MLPLGYVVLCPRAAHSQSAATDVGADSVQQAKVAAALKQQEQLDAQAKAAAAVLAKEKEEHAKGQEQAARHDAELAAVKAEHEAQLAAVKAKVWRRPKRFAPTHSPFRRVRSPI